MTGSNLFGKYTVNYIGHPFGGVMRYTPHALTITHHIILSGQYTRKMTYDEYPKADTYYYANGAFSGCFPQCIVL